jgi:hypothetical protein
MKRALCRFWFGNVFYRIPRKMRVVGYVSLRDRVAYGPFGIVYQTYSHHCFTTPILGKEKQLALRIFTGE